MFDHVFRTNIIITRQEMVPNSQNFFVTYSNWQKLKETYLEINDIIVPTYLPIISFNTAYHTKK